MQTPHVCRRLDAKCLQRLFSEQFLDIHLAPGETLFDGVAEKSLERLAVRRDAVGQKSSPMSSLISSAKWPIQGRTACCASFLKIDSKQRVLASSSAL
jgi:hypothetical protein